MPTGLSNQPEATQTSIRDMLLVLASLVVILAGARAASNLLIPFLLALFIAVVCSAPIKALRNRGVPGWLAGIAVGSGALLAVVLLFLLLGSTAANFADSMPAYQQQFATLLDTLANWLNQHGFRINQQAIQEAFNPADALGFFGSVISSLGEVLSNFVLIIFTAIFLLADASSFSAKLAASKSQHHGRYLAAFQQLAVAMNGYITTKALVSLFTAAMIWLGLVLLGVEFAVLWAFLAFILNFIPNIGSIIAAVPPVLLSLLALNPVLTGLIVALYIGVNMIVGNVIEPRWMGQRVGLSTLTVFLSLVVWGWMFGAVGMLLSVPLTMTLKFLALQHPSTLWISVMLSNPNTELQSTNDNNQSIEADDV